MLTQMAFGGAEIKVQETRHHWCWRKLAQIQAQTSRTHTAYTLPQLPHSLLHYLPT
jgi:hypothetical protein